MRKDTEQEEFKATADKHRKYRDAAALLPVLGFLALASPLFSAATTVEGGSALPRAIVYIFGVWACLISLAFFLARRLPSDNGPE